MTIQIPDDVKRRFYEAVQVHFQEQFDLDIGLVQYERLMDLILRTLGAALYNQAVTDAQAWLQGKLLDLEGDLHRPVDFSR